MFGALDNFFCDLEGKNQSQKQPGLSGVNTNPTKTRNKKRSRNFEINSLGSALYHLYVSQSVKENGLNGWKDDKEKFKIDLLNDLKTFLFGKWQKPWQPGLIFNDKGEIISGFRNIHGRVFKEGGNVIGLEANKGTSPFFITKPAIEKQKGEVNNKQKWVAILSYIPIADEADPKKVKFMLPKFHSVINVDFVDGIKKPVCKNVEFQELELNEYVENFIKELVKRKRIPTLHYDQADRAYYTHSLLAWRGDSIHLPLIKQFKNIEAFYSTLFHEITHSTMNPERCGRGKGALSFKTELPYANEELVAELGAMIICSELGLQYNRQNSLTYLKSWLTKAGKDSDTAMIEAYAYACDAADYLMKDIDFCKLVPASMQKRAEKESPDSPPTEPGKPRKSGVRTKVAKHNKAKGTKTTKIRIPKGATAQLEDETFVPYNYHEMQDELEQLGYKAIVPANDRNVSVTGKGKRLFKGNMRSALAVKNELNAMGYAVRLHKDADGIYDILVIGKLKKPDYESPTEALQRVTKELKKPFTPLRHAKQERLTNPIDIYIFKAGNLFRGIPTEQIKTLLIAFERLKKDKKGWAKYSETGDLWDLDLSAHEMDILGLDKDWNKEPESILFTLKSRFSYGLSELGEKIVNNYFAFKSVKANLKPFNTGQLRLFGLQGINEINDQFNNELNALITGKLPKNHVFYLGDMSDVLTIIGIKALPVELQANRLQRKTEQVNHVFEFQNLIDLPAKLNAPIMVFKSKTVVGSIVVLTEIIKDNHNFVVAIEIGRTITKWKKGEIQINDVRSIYPKDTFTDVLNWIEKDKLLQWVDKKKALELLVRWRSDYAKATQQIKSCTKIIQNFENGNTSLNGAKARKKEFWTEIKGEIQRVEKLENGMILWHDFTKGECRGIRSQTELFKTKKEAINYFKVGKKNTLGEIDIIPIVPRMPQMPTIETEITPVAPVQVPRMPQMPQMPQMPTDNMADLGFISDFNALQKGETFRLPGALGEFLGEYDRHCYSIALRGEKGAGKSRLVYQLMNAFASQGLNVAFLTLEMSYNSSISIGYRDEYIDPENIARIKPTEKAMTFDELDKVCKQFDVVVIDSWTKLKGMNQTDFDRLQKLNPRTIIVAIFQSTTGGVSRGGNMPEYDAGTVIQVNKGGFAECEKNRYAPCDKIFSVFDKMLIAPEAMEAV